MPVIPVAGAEKFANLPGAPAETRRAVGDALRLHDVEQPVVDDLDPLTYEVIRHRLTSITEEMGEALKRMSGSVVVTDCNDFDAAIMDEVGDVVQVGLYNTELAASLDMAVNWTLHHRVARPGIWPGDMFLCNDPWVGGGLHQNDVSLFAPLFIDGELFAWTGAVAHQVDLGGVSPGSWSVAATDVFWESVPIPPVKIVEAGEIRSDIEDVYLRRSRVPKLVALDLRAKIGANNVAHGRLKTLCEKYGVLTVKAVMRRLLDDAESRLRSKLSELPDGEWTAVAHQDSARSGDRGIYKIVCTLRKVEDRLVFDFTGTDPQVDGLINCTYAGLRGGIMPVLLTTLCGDIPWAPGGLYRCMEIISEPGTINNATFPAGIGKASVASAWATTNVVTECLAGLLDAHPRHRERLMSVCCGTWDFALLAGVDQRGGGFVTMLCDSMAGGLGARTHADGVDTGGLACIPMGRVADVEMNEFSFPMLYLWRREEPDSGGPGRFRGGVGASSCFVPHDSPIGGVHLVVSAPGKALPLAGGLSGGLPAGTQHDVLVRSSSVREQFSRGRIPASLAELGGDTEVVPSHYETNLAATDVYFTHWQGGGGYGDPLLREPAAVLRDVIAHKVSVEAAADVYGVVLTDGAVDDEATRRHRAELRLSRAGLDASREEFHA
jgi:N-methylhydantoinase B